MKKAFSMWCRIGRLRSITDWVEVTRHPLLILLYHHVGEEQEWHKHLYRAISPRQFESDIDTILQHFRPVSRQEVTQQVLSGIPFAEPVVWITFDDGLRSVADHALPVLQKRQVPCSLFINPDFTHQQDLMYRMKVSVLLERLTEERYAETRRWIASQWPASGTWEDRLRQTTYANRGRLDEAAARIHLDWAEYCRSHPIYLSGDELTALAGPLTDIGAHSLDHPMLAELDEEEALHQIEGSVQWVKRHCRQETATFAFPFTDAGLSHDFIRRTQSLPNAPDLLLGTAGIKQENTPFHLQRLAVDVAPASLMDQVAAAYAAARVKQKLGRYRVHR